MAFLFLYSFGSSASVTETSSTTFSPLPFCYDSTNAPHEWMYQQQPSCVVVVVVVVMVVVVRSDDFD